jgi:hypothetical protein
MSLGANVFVCESIVTRTERRWVPRVDPGARLGEMVPLDETVDCRCGHKYQAGSAATADMTAVCACGIFAVGLCAKCGTAVCGHDNCSDRGSGQLLCRVHADERARASAAQAAEEYERQEVRARKAAIAAQASYDAWAQAAAEEIAAVTDLGERTARAISASVCVTSTLGRKVDDFVVDEPLIRRLLPELQLPPKPTPEQLGSKSRYHQPPFVERWSVRTFGIEASWDHEAIADWFVRAVKGRRAPDTVVCERRTLLLDWKLVPTSGWRFEEGCASTRTISGDTRFCDVALTSSGKWLVGDHPTSRPTFNAHSLCRMAVVTGLPPLPERPRPVFLSEP